MHIHGKMQDKHKDIPSEKWTKDIFNMMADIEKKENGNEKLSSEWKEKALS